MEAILRILKSFLFSCMDPNPGLSDPDGHMAVTPECCQQRWVSAVERLYYQRRTLRDHARRSQKRNDLDGCYSGNPPVVEG